MSRRLGRCLAMLVVAAGAIALFVVVRRCEARLDRELLTADLVRERSDTSAGAPTAARRHVGDTDQTLRADSHAAPEIPQPESGYDTAPESDPRITGRVVGPDGKGVADGWVESFSESAERGMVVHRTAYMDADGAFEVACVEECRYTLVAWRGPRVKPGGRPGPFVEVAGVLAGSTDVLIRVEWVLEISGRVVDPSGAAVVEQPVVAWSADPNVTGAVAPTPTTTDSTGAFRLTGLLPGTYRLHVGGHDGDGQFDSDVEPSHVAAGTSGTVFVRTVTRLLTISGVVVDRSGVPIPATGSMGVGAEPIGPHHAGWLSESVGVNDDGSFVLDGLTPGVEYEIRSSGGGYRPGRAGRVLAVGRDDVRIVVERGLHASGHLVDATGRAIGRRVIVFQNVEDTGETGCVETAEDGAFDIEGLTEGPFRALIDDYSTGTPRMIRVGEFVGGATDVRLVMPDRE